MAYYYYTFSHQRRHYYPEPVSQRRPVNSRHVDAVLAQLVDSEFTVEQEHGHRFSVGILYYDLILSYGDRKLIIEVDGEQHFDARAFRGQSMTRRRLYDVNKTRGALAHGVPILRVHYRDVTQDVLGMVRHMVTNHVDLGLSRYSDYIWLLHNVLP